MNHEQERLGNGDKPLFDIESGTMTNLFFLWPQFGEENDVHDRLAISLSGALLNDIYA